MITIMITATVTANVTITITVAVVVDMQPNGCLSFRQPIGCLFVVARVGMGERWTRSSGRWPIPVGVACSTA